KKAIKERDEARLLLPKTASDASPIGDFSPPAGAAVEFTEAIGVFVGVAARITPIYSRPLPKFKRDKDAATAAIDDPKHLVDM
ncbi:hypothetical protein ACH5RR_013570, partial [Cinchona calisaya]